MTVGRTPECGCRKINGYSPEQGFRRNAHDTYLYLSRNSEKAMVVAIGVRLTLQLARTLFRPEALELPRPPTAAPRPELRFQSVLEMSE